MTKQSYCCRSPPQKKGEGLLDFEKIKNSHFRLSQRILPISICFSQSLKIATSRMNMKQVHCNPAMTNPSRDVQVVRNTETDSLVSTAQSLTHSCLRNLYSRLNPLFTK